MKMASFAQMCGNKNKKMAMFHFTKVLSYMCFIDLEDFHQFCVFQFLFYFKLSLYVFLYMY